MSADKVRIGVVAPGSRMEFDIAEATAALAAAIYGDRVDIVFHPQCYESWGHFAGTDESRAAAFVEIANDPAFDALWIGRGGYGACRVAPLVLPRLTPAAQAKTYLGYSDAGALLGALQCAGFQRVAHGPMPADIRRTGGAAAVKRALGWLFDRTPEGVEPHACAAPSVAFNVTILSNLIGTRYQPDVAGRVLMLEEVSEYAYRIDRSLCHITSNAEVRRAAGLRLGRCSDIPKNDVDFGQTEEEIARHWCAISGIPYLGRADIGHDIDNKIVPFA